MLPGRALRLLALAFLGVVLLYGGAFYGIEFWRHRRGPWQVAFLNDGAGACIVVTQPALGIGPTRISFAGERGGDNDFTQRVALNDPRVTLPFGKIIYADLTSWPGVVTFDLFGHEVELLPGELVVNERTMPWCPNMTLELSPTNRLPHPPRPPKGWAP